MSSSSEAPAHLGEAIDDLLREERGARRVGRVLAEDDLDLGVGERQSFEGDQRGGVEHAGALDQIRIGEAAPAARALVAAGEARGEEPRELLVRFFVLAGVEAVLGQLELLRVVRAADARPEENGEPGERRRELWRKDRTHAAVGFLM